MSSPKTRAQGSSSSVPPDYITGAGVDNHAIEVRSKLHPFAQKNLDENVLHLFENTLVLGPHWFGLVPPEMAELMKKDAEAPLCFESASVLTSHTWVSKNLSRSFPSSEVRNTHWRRAGIYDPILLSKQSINRDENLLAALCFGIPPNTFDFRIGPMAPTLLDMAQIFGFRPHGRPVDAVGDYHRRKNQEKLAKPFTISPASINQNCSFSHYLKKFSAEKDKDQQHMLFLLYWLEYRHLAEALHNHTDVGLGPTVLAHLFKNLYSATLENPLNLTAPGAFWMIQIWLQVYFPELSFPDVVPPEDQPGYRLFEKEPEEETARTDFRKKFLSVTLPRHLPYGDPSLTQDVGGQSAQAGEVFATSVITAGDLELPSGEEEEDQTEQTLVEATSSVRRKRKDIAPSTISELEEPEEAEEGPQEKAKLVEEEVSLVLVTDAAIPFEEIPAEVIAESIALAQKQREDTIAGLTSSELALFEDPEGEHSTAVLSAEERASPSASEPVDQTVVVPEAGVEMDGSAPEVMIEVPQSAGVLAAVASPLKPPICYCILSFSFPFLPGSDLCLFCGCLFIPSPGSSATASFADPEPAEFEAMDLDAQRNIGETKLPSGQGKIRTVEEAIERPKIRLKWNRSRMRIGKLLTGDERSGLLHRRNGPKTYTRDESWSGKRCAQPP
ncbi:unnamed protein product [Prunus brigantina]